MPCSIYELQHLTTVNLYRCRNLVKFRKWSAESLPGNSNVSPDLWYLNLSGCKSLEEIPELPPRMERVNAADCVSLERFANFSNILEQKGEQMIECVTLLNCQKLCDNLARDLSKNQSISPNKVSLCSVIFSSQQGLFNIIFPGSEVPKWFSHREDLCNKSDKSEFSFEIPLHLNLENRGLAICAVVEISQKGKQISQKEKGEEKEISQKGKEVGQKEKEISQKGKEIGQVEKEICQTGKEIDQKSVTITPSNFGRCHLTTRVDINGEKNIAPHSVYLEAKYMESAHVWLLYIPFLKIVHSLERPCTDQVSTCRVRLEHTSKGLVFCKSCGVHLVMPQDEDLKDEDEETHENLEDEYSASAVKI